MKGAIPRDRIISVAVLGGLLLLVAIGIFLIVTYGS